MRAWRALRAVIVAALLVVVPRVAVAQRVLLARPPRTDPTLFEAFGRLRAELELHAFEVVVLEDRPRPRAADELEREAQARGAFAAIALQRSQSGTTAEIWIVDRVTGKTTARKLRIEPSAHGPTLLAVRAADLLRASLLELAPGERPSEDVVGVVPGPPPMEVVRFSQQVPRFQVQIGGMVLHTPALGSSVGLSLGTSFRPIERLAIGIDLGGPLFGGAFDARIGSASVRQELALLRLGWIFSSGTPGSRLEWGPFIGAGAYHLEATGVVEPPLVAQTDASWSVIANAGAGLRYFFDQTVSAGLDVSAIALFPRAVIAIDDQHSAPAAVQGLASLSLGLAF